MQKHKMQLVALATFLFCLIGQLASAQQGRGRMSLEQRQNRMTALMDSLEMDDIQREKFIKLEQDVRAEMRKARESSEGDRGAMREKMQALNKQRVTVMKQFLSEDQFAKYKEITQRAREQRRERRQDGERPRRGKKAKEKEKTEKT